MKIIQIVAAYKPAYIYGGPTMSVAKLSESLVKESLKTKDQRLKEEKESPESKVQSLESKGKESASNLLQETNCDKSVQSANGCNQSLNEKFELEVFTTTANGKEELPVEPNQSNWVDGVKVTYFKRLTKDHTHFSPALLWRLRKECKESKYKKLVKHPLPFGEGWGGDLIHIHAWWNLVSIFSCAIAKWYHVPVILSPRGMLTAYTKTNRNSLAKRMIHTLLGKSLLKYCHIHVTSEKEKRDVLSIITPKSITVIPNLVELGEGIETKDQRPKRKVQSLESKVESSESKVQSYHADQIQETNCSQSVRSDQLCNQPRSEKNLASSVHRTASDQATPNVQSSESKVLIPLSDQFTETNANQSVQSTNRCNQPRSEHFKLIFLSRIEEKKGLALLFEALSLIPFKWNLTIAGSGEKDYVESLKLKVESLNIAHRIDWVGQVNNEAKFELLAEHDLMVLTSYNENFANVVIESLSVGTAVLVSNEVGLADYVEDNKLGWITELDAYTIKKSMITAFDSANSRDLIRQTAPQIINKDFNSANLIQKYFTLYAQMN